MQTIFDFVKEQRTQYRAYTIEIADGYEYSQYQIGLAAILMGKR